MNPKDCLEPYDGSACGCGVDKRLRNKCTDKTVVATVEEKSDNNTRQKLVRVAAGGTASMGCSCLGGGIGVPKTYFEYKVVGAVFALTNAEIDRLKSDLISAGANQVDLHSIEADRVLEIQRPGTEFGNHYYLVNGDHLWQSGPDGYMCGQGSWKTIARIAGDQVVRVTDCDSGLEAYRIELVAGGESTVGGGIVFTGLIGDDGTEVWIEPSGPIYSEKSPAYLVPRKAGAENEIRTFSYEIPYSSVVKEAYVQVWNDGEGHHYAPYPVPLNIGYAWTEIEWYSLGCRHAYVGGKRVFTITLDNWSHSWGRWMQLHVRYEVGGRVAAPHGATRETKN